MVVVPLRPWASAKVHARFCAAGYSCRRSKMRRCYRLRDRSPFVPSSYNAWLAEPPIGDKLHDTVMPVLTGFVPGATVTVRRLWSPGSTAAGSAEPTAANGKALLRGFGVPTTKSALLLSVSCAPSDLRSAAVVLLKLGVGVVSEQLVALPNPTKSTTAAVGHEVPEADQRLLLTSATFPRGRGHRNGSRRVRLWQWHGAARACGFLDKVVMAWLDRPG